MHITTIELGEILASFCNAARQWAASSADPAVINMLNQLLKETGQMSGALDNLTTKLTAMETVGDGMAALLSDLSARIRAADDSEKLNALAADVDAKTAAWTAAVTANTPAADETTPPTDEPAPVDTSVPSAAPEPTPAAPADGGTAEPAPTTPAPAEPGTDAPQGTETQL